jgi:hypothetical protein
VLFTPEDGGRLVATDGKRLGCCPATVPSQPFVLPVAACHILGHPDFTADMATITWIDHEEPEKRHVAIHSGRHLLVSKLLVGNYPSFKQVIPTHAQELAVIPHDRKPGLIAWLRSVGKDQASVRLDWHKRGQLTLTHRDANGHSAAMQVEEVTTTVERIPTVLLRHVDALERLVVTKAPFGEKTADTAGAGFRAITATR